MNRHTLDVAALPDHAFGHKGLIWWGTTGFMVIEGSMFAMAAIVYFVLRTRSTGWPPALPNPDATLGTINLIILLASVAPNLLTKRAAERYDLRRVRPLLLLMLAIGVAPVVIRCFEFGSLHASWDTSAYGSIVWFIMGLHTLHLVTDVVDTAVLAALIFAGHTQARRFVDVSENALYWNFVVVSWVPIYLVVYFAPRWL